MIDLSTAEQALQAFTFITEEVRSDCSKSNKVEKQSKKVEESLDLRFDLDSYLHKKYAPLHLFDKPQETGVENGPSWSFHPEPQQQVVTDLQTNILNEEETRKEVENVNDKGSSVGQSFDLGFQENSENLFDSCRNLEKEQPFNCEGLAISETSPLVSLGESSHDMNALCAHVEHPLFIGQENEQHLQDINGNDISRHLYTIDEEDELEIKSLDLGPDRFDFESDSGEKYESNVVESRHVVPDVGEQQVDQSQQEVETVEQQEGSFLQSFQPIKNIGTSCTATDGDDEQQLDDLNHVSAFSVAQLSRESFVESEELEACAFATASLFNIGKDSKTRKNVQSIQSVVDSGAIDHISCRRDLFASFTGETVALRVADRVLHESAHRGTFKANSLGLVDGLYHPELGPELLLSVGNLEERSYVVTFEKNNNRICLPCGARYPIQKVEKLYRTPVVFPSLSQSSDGLECFDVETANARCYAMSRAEKLRLHEQHAHFHLPGLDIQFCPACALQKGRSEGHANQRPEELKPTEGNDQIDADFVGPFTPTSWKGNKWLLVILETYWKWPEVFPCATRDECGEKLREYCRRVGIPKRARSDNGKEFKEPGSSWRKVCEEKGILVYYAPPYHPAENGMVERMNQTIQSGMRASLTFVDKRMWDWAAIYVCYTWQRLTKRDGSSPYKSRFGRTPSTKHFRRFGCLCFAREHVKENKLSPRYRPGIFLGYSLQNSCYLVGHFKSDDRRAVGESFVVEENRDVKFVESVLISDVEHLRLDSVGRFLQYLPLEDGAEGAQDRSVVPSGVDRLDVGAPAVEKPLSLQECVDEQRNLMSDSKRDPAADENPAQESPRITVENTPDGVAIKKKRGRPKGTKAKEHWKKPGPKPRTVDAKPKSKKQRKKEKQAKKSAWSAAFTAKVEKVHETLLAQVDQQVEKAISKQIDLASETSLCYTIQLTRKQVLESPDVAKWIEADTLERTQLEAMKCWRPVRSGEVTADDEIIPAVMVYTRKRDGRYKARLVALGNRQNQVLPSEIYSPTVSHAANRTLLIRAASRGDFLESFDISNAFILSMLNTDDNDPNAEKVIVRLPPHWAEDGKRGDLVRLLRGLYGLRISPRRWFDTYAAYLKTLGWEMCPREPGLWRRGQLLLSIYVDDTLMSGPNLLELRKARDQILSKFPGKIIEPVRNGKWLEWDVLGATLRYCREERRLEITMEHHIKKLLEKFRMQDCRIVSTPCTGASLVDEKTNETFPIRSLVGALQHISNICRPDITFAVQRCARHMLPKTSQKCVDAAKRILQYLKGTIDRGLLYSPENEEAFCARFREIARAGGREDIFDDFTTFSDTDFAGCSLSFRSTSGGIMYYKGTPIVWKSARQSIRAYSTCEAEYVGLYDSLRLSQGQGYLDWFLEEKELPIHFGDNQSSLALAKTSLPTKKSKHFMLRYSLVRDHCKSLCYCPTDDNRADPLTKAVPAQKYIQIFDATDMHDEPEQENEEQNLQSYLVETFPDRFDSTDFDFSILCA